MPQLSIERGTTAWGGGGGGVLKKILYGEAPPGGPTPYPFIYHFFQKRQPFRIPFIGKGHPFQKSCLFFHVARNKLK